MPSIEDILSRIKAPVRSVRVCLDGDLWGRHDELTARLSEQPSKSGKMGDSSAATKIADELAEVEAAMRAAEVEFKFRGVSPYVMEEIAEKYPAKGGRGGINSQGVPVLLAAAAVEPAMTEDQARQLMVTDGIASKLFGCAMAASQGSLDVPFFGHAFDAIQGSESR